MYVCLRWLKGWRVYLVRTPIALSFNRTEQCGQGNIPSLTHAITNTLAKNYTLNPLGKLHLHYFCTQQFSAFKMLSSKHLISKVGYIFVICIKIGSSVELYLESR